MTIVLIFEWDGEKPPSGYYRRRHRYGLYVGSRDTEGGKGAIERRVSSGNINGVDYNAVIFQEGCLVCDSEALAKNVYQKAMELADLHGIRLSCQWIDGYSVDVHLSADDRRSYNAVESVLGKSGRPSGKKADWIITCYECGSTVEVKDSYNVVVCTECGSSKIESRHGEFKKLLFPKGDLFDAWFAHRFSCGSFEVPDVRDATRYPDWKPTVTDKKDSEAINEIMRSGIASDLARGLPREVAINYLDAIFLSRRYKSKKAREDARTRAILELYRAGIEIPLFELTSVSILDAAAIGQIGPQTAAGAYMKVYAKDK